MRLPGAAPGGGGTPRMPESLAVVFSQGGELCECACPWFAGFRAHVGVAEVIEDEPEPGERAGGGHRGRQVARLADHVVGEARLGHRGQAAQHGRPGQPVRVGLDQHGVPYACQAVAAGKFAQLRQHVGDMRRGQVCPADHARDQAGPRGEGKQFRRFPGFGDGLHHDGRRDALGRGQRCQVRQREVPQQRCQHRIAGQPGLVMRGQVPEVLMGIDDRRPGRRAFRGRGARRGHRVSSPR